MDNEKVPTPESLSERSNVKDLVPSSPQKSKLPLISVVFLFFLILGFSGIFLGRYLSTIKTSSPQPTLAPKPTINPVDKSTGLNRSKLSVTVQNGSGQAGVAGKAADILKNLGYNVTSTGNADNYDFVNVSIQVKALSSEFLALLKKDLAESYTIGSNSADLSTSFSSDALVIIGK